MINIKIFKKKYSLALTYTLVLSSFTGYVLLHTFVIPEVGVVVKSDSTTSSGTNSSSNATITDTSYEDENISINISTIRKYDTDVYVVDIQVSSVEYLKTAFANSTYGKNITATTSSTASANNAILAINGDYYGFRNAGFVLRNGVIYRSTATSSTSEALVINSDGSLSVAVESETSLTDLLNDGALQVLSFGPSLIVDSEYTVDSTSEVSQAMTSNPRTAIGMISPLHYVIVVSDGRTSESAGLTLYELATIFKSYNCSLAYNLDGGGSSTLWFNGNIINNPTSGSGIAERKVSDIVYIGY